MFAYVNICYVLGLWVVRFAFTRSFDVDAMVLSNLRGCLCTRNLEKKITVNTYFFATSDRGMVNHVHNY